MTSDPYAKANPGEKLTIHATAWNKLLDTVRPSAAALPGEDFEYSRTHFRVNCQNNSGTAIPQWSILKIKDVLLGSSGAAAGSWLCPGVVGEVPGTTGSYVVAVEPIRDGGIGKAAIGGVVQSRLRVNCTGHQYATPKPGEVNYLETSDVGPFRILWRGSTAPANPTGVSGPNNPWAIVMFAPAEQALSASNYDANKAQILGHLAQTTGSGSTGCTGWLQWYSVTQCDTATAYATTYFL